MALSIVDLLYQGGVPNPSGLATMHGIALLSDFTTIEAPDALTTAGATNVLVASIATAHVFAEGLCMRRLYGSENKGDVKEEVVGDADSQSAKCTVSIMVPGLTTNYHAAKMQLNAEQGLLFVTMADGQVMQYGSATFPVRFKVTWGSDKNEGYRGYTITGTCYGDGIVYTPGLNFTPAVS